jgi:hypothetical protein
MSIRKHYVQDFKQFIESLKNHGFTFFEQYRKANALIGESNTIAFINLYFLDANRRDIMMKFCSQPYRNEFLSALLELSKDSKFLDAFDDAIDAMKMAIFLVNDQ